MAFHRLTVPTYFGGLPGGFDYINTPSDPTVGGSGVPAPMDTKKTGGPNDGTYFVAFGEDGRATFANRGMKALAQNTDAIDDILRTSIPKVITTDLTAVGAVSTVALTGEIFVGEFGMANNATNRNLLVHVTEQSSNDDLEVGGTKIVPTLIHDGASANVVGTIASGFRTNASVNFSPSIPNGTNYRVWYGIRSSLAEISATEKGAYFKYLIRNAEHISGTARSLFRQLHSEGSVNQAYDAAWDSTIRSLASSGLNERYRRSTTQPAGFVTGDYNVAGGGRAIVRDGGAVEVRSAIVDITASQYPDSQLADIRTAANSGRSVLSNFSNARGGDVGFLHETESIKHNFTAEAVRDTFSGPGYLEIMPRDIRASLAGVDNVLTFINPNSNGTLNPDSINNDTNRSTIQCAAGQYFRRSGATAIRPTVDLIEVVYSGRAPETYLITSIVSDTRITVLRFNRSSNLIFPAVATACTIRWIQTLYFVGGTTRAGLGSAWGSTKFFYAQPAQLTDNPAVENWPAPAAFYAALNTSGVNANGYTALGWGCASTATMSGIPAPSGFLRGDGSIDALGLRMATGDLTLAAGSITLSVGGITANNDIHSLDDLVADDDIIAGDRLVSSGNAVIGGSLSVNKPTFFYTFNEDFIRVTQFFSPNVIHTADHTWLFNEITSTMTVNNGTPSAKNPGQFQVIASGGGTAKRLAVYPTSQFPWAFANLELFEATLAVNDNVANNYSAISAGFFDATTTGTGNDVLAVAYINGNWVILHVVAGVPGAHNLAVLGAEVNDTFVVVRFVKTNGIDIDIFFNGVLATTVLAAEIPTGNCTLLLFYEQTAGDANATTWTVDDIAFRFSTAADRSGL